jgi:protein-disulfide isomerase
LKKKHALIGSLIVLNIAAGAFALKMEYDNWKTPSHLVEKDRATFKVPEAALASRPMISVPNPKALLGGTKDGASYFGLDIENPANAPTAGNAAGDVTVVQFFDYNCPHCKSSYKAVEAAIKGDGKTHMIYREYPILGDHSIYAARAALAANKQGRYHDVHAKFMAFDGILDADIVIDMAEDMHLDVTQLLEDMEDPAIDAHIRRSYDLAKANGIKGTPVFSINGEINPGAPSKSAMEEAIMKARAVK